MIFAHRGASGLAPENTMAAFRLAVDLGCEAIELDVQQTSDGQLVISHDESLNRTTNGNGFLKDFTLAELQQLDAGSWFEQKYAGEKIPTLDQLLAYVKETNVLVNIEIKNLPFIYDGIERKVVQLVHQYGMAQRVIISSFDHYALQKTANFDPSLKLGVLFDTRLIEPWEYVNRLPFPVYSIHPHVSFVDAEFLNESHNNNYKVIAYTVDQVDWYREYNRLGIDGIFTDFPERFM